MGIIDKIMEILEGEQEFPNFNGKNWKPAQQLVIKDESIKQAIERDGYKVVQLMDQPLIEELTAIYHKYHDRDPGNGGMFYSLYSQDIEYRKNVNREVLEALEPTFKKLFKDYRAVLGSFIIKHQGPKSEFNLHQDSTGLNEWKYSPLSFWMPLQETTVENGCMWVLPKSHGWFSPYRSISFPSMFEKHQDMLRPYLVPVELKLGEVLLFDNRIVHMSGMNLSEFPRVIVMSGIFPKEAQLISCYRDTENNGPMEIYNQEDDFLVVNKHFYIDCTARPVLGTKSAECKKVKYELSEKELTDLLANSGLVPEDLYGRNLAEIRCDIIEEPR